MSSTIFALLLFGCSDDGSACQRLNAQPKLYDSRVLCEADIDVALESDLSSRSDYPSVIARCVSANALASIDEATIDSRTIDLREGRLAIARR